MTDNTYIFWYPVVWMDQLTLSGASKKQWVICGDGHLENDFSGALLCGADKQHVLQEEAKKRDNPPTKVEGKSYKERQTSGLCAACAKAYMRNSKFKAWAASTNAGKTFQLPGASNETGTGTGTTVKRVRNSKTDGRSASSKAGGTGKRGQGNHSADAG